MLWCGDSGAGKTQGLAGWPGPVYIADCDGRIRTIKKAAPKRDDIWYDTFSAFQYLDFAKTMDSIEAKPWQNALVVVDSLGTMCDMALEYSMETRGGRKSKVGILDMYEIADFGVESRGVMSVIHLLRSLPCHVVLTAHYYEYRSKKGLGDAEIEIVNRSVVTGAQKVAAKVPGFFDEVWYFETQASAALGDPPQYWVNTITRGNNPARTTLPLPARFNWTNKNLFEVVKGFVDGKEDVSGRPVHLQAGPPPEGTGLQKPTLPLLGGK